MEDQRRIMLGLATRRVTTNAPVESGPTASSSRNKRKLAFDESPAPGASRQHHIGSEEVASLEIREEEAIEELYATMITKTVGVQYYTGQYVDLFLITQGTHTCA